MASMYSRILIAVVIALAVVAGRQALAQEAVLSDLYGRGVHQYFAGNDAEAADALSAAIDGGTKDPRAYYFRALVGMRSGFSDVESDLRKAAELEIADSNLLYPVGKALERVQGANRMTIERYRSVARAEAHQRQLRRDLLRYEERKRTEGEIVRPPAALPAPGRAPAVAPPVPAPEPAADDPFGDSAPKAVAPPAAQPPDSVQGEESKAPASKEADDPFAEPPSGDKPDENPFGDEPKDEK
jgi:hypothetical protein